MSELINLIYSLLRIILLNLKSSTENALKKNFKNKLNLNYRAQISVPTYNLLTLVSSCTHMKTSKSSIFFLFF